MMRTADFAGLCVATAGGEANYGAGGGTPLHATAGQPRSELKQLEDIARAGAGWWPNAKNQEPAL